MDMTQSGESDTRLSRRIHVTDPDAAFAEVQAENDSLVSMVAALEKRLPTDEELAYLRNRKAADDNAAWLWKTIKAHAPWAVVVCSALTSAIYWLATHTITIAPGPNK